MKHIFIYLILAVLCLYAPPREQNDWDRAKIFILENTTNYSHAYRQRLCDAILFYGWKYQLPLYLWAKQIHVESRFNRHAVSSANCRGLTQIGRYWMYVFYRVDNGRLGRYLKRKGRTDLTRYYHRVGYNLDAGGYIMRKLINKHGCHKIALLRYGYKTSAFKKHRKNPDKAEYIRMIYE
jgi:hypothetical protein